MQCLVLVTNDLTEHISCTPVIPYLKVLLISQLTFAVLMEVVGGFPLLAEVGFHVIQRLLWRSIFQAEIYQAGSKGHGNIREPWV